MSPDELKKFLAETGIPGSTQAKYFRIFKDSTLPCIKQRILHLIRLTTGGYTLKRSVLTYGKEKGLEKWKNYCKRQAYTNSQEYKGMSDEEFKKYNKSRAVTKANLVRRHGKEKGTEMWKAYCEKQSYTKSVEYFIDRFGEEEGRKKFKEVNLTKSASLENMIRRYGEEERVKKYEEYKSKTKIFHSKEAPTIFEELDKELKTLEFLPKTREFSLLNRFYDCFHPETGTVIEYNGGLWHANPTVYKTPEEFEKRVEFFGFKWDDIKSVDELKERLVLKNGFRLIVLWQSYAKPHRETIIKELLELIKSDFKGKVELI